MQFINGTPVFDEQNKRVNAHGAGVVKEGNRYYLFGEYKTDDENRFDGFSCYSTTDFTHWTNHGIVLGVQNEGILGPERIGERCKVVKSSKTGQYVMFSHTDNLQYNDPQIGVAVSNKIEGPYTMTGPLLYDGKIVRRWDMGVFTDDDGIVYLMTHEGYIYRLSEDCLSAEELLASEFAQGGEAPCMMKKDGMYYIVFSAKTSWERNDNYYYTSSDLRGPWEYGGLIAPEGSLTYNSQATCIFCVEVDGNNIPVYLGDRWSFPMQKSAATMVWLPIKAGDGRLSVGPYQNKWSPMVDLGEKEVEDLTISFYGKGIELFAKSVEDGGYARIRLTTKEGDLIDEGAVEFYAKVESEGLKYKSPELPEQDYILTIENMHYHGIYSDKSGRRFGSFGDRVIVKGYVII